MKNLLALLFLATMATACYDGSDCSNSYSSQLNLRFYNIDSLDSGGARIPKTISLAAYAFSDVDWIFIADTTVSTIGFPVNPNSDTTRYHFYIMPSDTTAPRMDDTLEVIFNRRYELSHPECGITQIFEIDTVFSTFDTINAPQRTLRFPEGVGEGAVINVEIFL